MIRHTLSLLLIVGFHANGVFAQSRPNVSSRTSGGEKPATEKLRIDNQTVSVIQSPWKFVKLPTTAGLRGLHVYSSDEIWASGTEGTIVHSCDGGQTWRVRQIAGSEKLDFRDIQAIGEGTALAISSGTPSRIYRTTNGGSTWKLCYENKHPKVFFNSLSFWDDTEGIAMADPIDGRLLLIRTINGGKTWRTLAADETPEMLPGESGFAGSGTNMATIGQEGLVIALANGNRSGRSPVSRIVGSDNRGKTWWAGVTPLTSHPTAGVFSVCYVNEKSGCVVGGDFKRPDATDKNHAVTSDSGKTWSVPSPAKPPSGYRSCVAKLNHGKQVYLISVGPNGTDLSADLGASWRRISNYGFHTVQFSTDGKSGWATGEDGRIARWIGGGTPAKK